MRTYEKGIVHEKGISLSEEELNWLSQKTANESEQILTFYKKYPQNKFAAHEVADILDIREGNARRSCTDLAQTDPNKKNYMDQWKQAPLIKLGDEHKVTRQFKSGRQVKVHCWVYNKDYGIEPQQSEVDEDGQASMFANPKVNAKNGVYSR